MKPNKFFNCTYYKRPDVIADGYDYLATTVDTTTLNLKKLTAWVNQMPDVLLQNNIEPDERMQKAFEQYQRAYDTMSAAMIENEIAFQRLRDTINLIKQYGNTSKTISE